MTAEQKKKLIKILLKINSELIDSHEIWVMIEELSNSFDEEEIK